VKWGDELVEVMGHVWVAKLVQQLDFGSVT